MKKIEDYVKETGINEFKNLEKEIGSSPLKRVEQIVESQTIAKDAKLIGLEESVFIQPNNYIQIPVFTGKTSRGSTYTTSRSPLNKGYDVVSGFMLNTGRVQEGFEREEGNFIHKQYDIVEIPWSHFELMRKNYLSNIDNQEENNDVPTTPTTQEPTEEKTISNSQKLILAATAIGIVVILRR